MEKCRSLGNLERYSAARHELGFYNNVGLTATHRSPTTPVNEDALRPYIHAACRATILRHPALCVVPIATSPTEAHFARLPSVDLEQCVAFRERTKPGPLDDGDRDDELDELLEVEHSQGFGSDASDGRRVPFWRIVVLLPHLSHVADVADFTLLFLFHHALGDGLSGLAFHRTFARALHAQSRDTDISSVVPIPPTLSLLPPLESLVSLPISWTYFLSTILSNFVPSFLSRSSHSSPWTGHPIQPHPKTTRFHSLVFPHTLTTRFARACRAHEVSVTAVLQSILAASILACVSLSFTFVQGSLIVSLRRFISTAAVAALDDEFTVLAGAMTLTHTRASTADEHGSKSEFALDNSGIVVDARRTRDALRGFLGKGTRDLSVSLLRYVPDVGAWLRGQVGKKRELAFEVSSLGQWQAGRGSRDKAKGSCEGGNNVQGEDDGFVAGVGRVVFSQSVNVAGPAITMSAITGGDGCLVLGFTWQEEVVEEGVVAGVMKKIAESVTKFSETGS